MFKTKVVFMFLVIFMAFALLSCGNNDEPSRFLKAGDSLIIEAIDVNIGDKEDYGRLKLTVLEVTYESFTIELQLQELKIGDEGVEFYIENLLDCECIEIFQDGEYISWDYDSDREKLDLNINEPIILKCFVKNPKTYIFPRNLSVAYVIDPLEAGILDVFFYVDPIDTVHRVIYLSHTVSWMINWNEFWTFKWLGALFN